MLAGWDGRSTSTAAGRSSGAIPHRTRRDNEDGLDGLWRTPFDADEPVETPSGLRPARRRARPVLVALARPCRH